MDGRIQSFAMSLQDLAQDSPGNCAHEQQFGTNLLRWMASLIITLSRRSSNSLPNHTMDTTRLPRLLQGYWDMRPACALNLGKLPCGLLLPYQWLV